MVNPVTGLPALDNTMGALFIGVLLAMALWGAGTVQVYNYFDRYQKDDYRIKLLVIAVWGLDTTHQALITHSVYTYLVTEYGNGPFLLTIVSSLLTEVIISALVSLLVQCFFVVRIWRLSRKNYMLVGVIMSLVLSNFVASIVYTAKAYGLHTYANLTKIKNLSRAINALGAAGDILIALVLIYLLQSSRTGFQRSDNIINRLILFSLNTSLLTSLSALTSLITITVLPNTFIYIMFYVATSRLYTNSLLAVLNARKSIRGETEGTENISMSAGRYRQRTMDNSTPGPGAKSGLHTPTNPLSIKVETETLKDSDSDFNGDSQSFHPFSRKAQM